LKHCALSHLVWRIFLGLVFLWEHLALKILNFWLIDSISVVFCRHESFRFLVLICFGRLFFEALRLGLR